MQAKYKIKEEFTNETIQESFLNHASHISTYLFDNGIISIYVVFSANLSRIRFFESLITTNLIVPFGLNTIYLSYLLFKTIMPNDK